MTLKATATLKVAVDEIRIEVRWSGQPLDRPVTGGWVVRNNQTHAKLAQRLVRAVNAGAAHGEAKVLRDVNGNSYVEANALVSGRCMNADLKRLGY